MDEAKPHCGLIPNLSKGTYLVASEIRCLSPAGLSILAFFVETRPKTTNLSSGISFRGSNEPERVSSYSSNRRCALVARKSRLLMAS